EPEPIRGRNVDSHLLAGSHGVWQGVFDPGCKFYKNRKGSSPQTVCLLEKTPTSTHAYDVQSSGSAGELSEQQFRSKRRYHPGAQDGDKLTNDNRGLLLHREDDSSVGTPWIGVVQT
ncbi:hypothetical protein Cfor_08567, partial [Coptotermes formosanus]